MKKSNVKATATKSNSGGGSIIGSFSEQKASSNFQDKLFPPTYESLFSTKKEVAEYQSPSIPKFLRDKRKFLLSQFALSSKEGRYSWSKLDDIVDASKLNIFKDNRNAQLDVVQGELGDCYFLSVLAALATNPKNINELVDARARASDSSFNTTVIIHGEPVNVVVDDNFPVANDRALAFAGINENSGNIWPIILEKAWAKCNKTYEDIIPGNSADAFEFLSPAPFDTYYHNSETRPTLFDTITNANKKGYIVLADITETGATNLEILSKLGLITNHAYSIINTAVLKKGNGIEIKLIKMKNLWGTNEWVGDWSDDSNKWTTEFKNQVGLEQKDDGIFWISYEDYLQFYTTTHVCQIHSDYEYSCERFKAATKQAPADIAKITVKGSGSGYFIVNQKNTRIYRNLKNPDYENPFCNVVVFRKDNNGYTYVGSESGKQDRLYVECENLVSGNYYVLVTFPGESDGFSLQSNFENIDEPHNFRVGIYSNQKGLAVEPVNEKEREDVRDAVFEILYNCADANPDKYYFAQEGEPKAWRAINFDNNSVGFGYIFYKNDSDAFLREKVTIKGLNNVAIIPYLQPGVFMGRDEEEPKPETSDKLRGKPGKQKDEVNDFNEQVDYESKNISNTIKALKGTELESNVEIIEGGDGKPVSEKAPGVIQFNIAPHSECGVYLQKTGEEADIDLNSDLCLDYLPNVFLSEQKFRSKKYKLRYNNNPVEVYECVTEHNTGVFFLYKNRDSELRIKVTAKFTKLNNLYLAITSSDLEEGKQMKLREPNGENFMEEGGNTVTLFVEPGETGFFGLSAIDSFEKFSYTCQFDYLFTVAKVPAKFQQFVEGDQEEEEEEE